MATSSIGHSMMYGIAHYLNLVQRLPSYLVQLILLQVKRKG